ncbi:MAG TPA: hypothetical protein VGD67_12840 [Pseudonocardiaceae bacterium]
MSTDAADPFGTAGLRAAALQAWRSSPTRFREDANAEEDLVLGGYRDRWFVELAQNAADAAVRAGVPGVLRVSLGDGELRVANTGAPLDAAGVTALASLRASDKRAGGSVGRFGVGFAAVLPVSARPSVVSATGGVLFSEADTRSLVDADPVLAQEMARRQGQVPVLRLPWPVPPGERAPEGFDTEVRLPLRPGVDGPALVAAAAAQVADLLLALPGLWAVEVADARWHREEHGDTVLVHGPSGAGRWRVLRRAGALPSGLVLAAEERHRPQWTICWAVPVSGDGAPLALGEDVLHGPTPTDERLSLPARLLATLPVEPSRRRLRPGPAAEYVLEQAVRAYPELVRLFPPAARTALVPAAGFPLSDVDGRLRAGLVAALRAEPWLPAAEPATHDGRDPSGTHGHDAHDAHGDRPELAPAKTCVLDLPLPGLAGLLADVLPGLAGPAFSEPGHAPALAVLEVPRVGLAAVVDAVSGLDREPAWWRRLYTALAPSLDTDPYAREALAALPVPLTDGRTVTGPRSTVLLDTPMELADLRVVHPAAAHPLLERLGAERAGPRELLESEALREAVERSLDDAEAGLDVGPLIGTVLALVGELRDAPSYLAALALPDEDGEPCRADELVLPDAALRPLLAPDGPLGVLDPDLAAEHPREAWRAIGVLDGFAVVVDEEPTGPDHDLADEEQWWDGLDEPPVRLEAVRDLDLVDDDAWPEALRLLASDPATARAVRGSYTAWWLARHALLDGVLPPRAWRLAGADSLEGLYDVVPDVGLDESLLAAIGVRTGLSVADADDAEDLVDRLADPRRTPMPATVQAAHAELVAAAADGLFDVDTLDLPTTVRTVGGAVVDAGTAYVIDRPWLWGVVDRDRAVAGGDPDGLAALLDLPLGSAVLDATVGSTGRRVAWAALPEVAAACEALDRPVPAGTVVLHDELRVRVAGGAERAVPYWVDGDGVHAADPVHAVVFTGPGSEPLLGGP